MGDFTALSVLSGSCQSVQARPLQMGSAGNPGYTESPVQTYDRIWTLSSALFEQHNKAEGRNTAWGHPICCPVFSVTWLQQLSSAE